MEKPSAQTGQSSARIRASAEWNGTQNGYERINRLSRPPVCPPITVGARHRSRKPKIMTNYFQGKWAVLDTQNNNYLSGDSSGIAALSSEIRSEEHTFELQSHS